MASACSISVQVAYPVGRARVAGYVAASGSGHKTSPPPNEWSRWRKQHRDCMGRTLGISTPNRIWNRFKSFLKGFFRGSILAVVLTALVSTCCWNVVSPCAAAEARYIDDFVWKKDKLTGVESASSQGDSSLNFFDVGDLSQYSLYLVQHVLASLSNATGKRIDRSLKESSIAIFHDSKVFSRLKTEKRSFTALGISDEVLDQLRARAGDDVKCVSMTRTDEKNSIVFTVILLSEKSDECLIGGLLNSFGIAGSEISIKKLISACVLYEGRRLGFRDRQSLSQEASRLRDLCLGNAGAIER